MNIAEANLKYIASAGGLSAKTLAKKGEVAFASSDYKEILEDAEVDMVMITTRHNLHASMAKEALEAGKHVFVEKPLCLTSEELEEISTLAEEKNKMVVVGFNRRFAPLAVKMKSLLGEGPKNIVATMNAGFIPADVWIHDLEVGGGRIIGEACHYIDLCTYLAGSKVVSVCMNALGTDPEENTDNASILLKYENGTNAVINYFANGSKSYAKERIEAHSQERTLVLDNWRSLKGYGVKGFTKMKIKQDKGHKAQFELLVDSLKKGGKAIVPFEETYNTTLASFAAIESLKQGRWVRVDEVRAIEKAEEEEVLMN
jgi:predicted dehydrogenase